MDRVLWIATKTHLHQDEEQKDKEGRHYGFTITISESQTVVLREFNDIQMCPTMVDFMGFVVGDTHDRIYLTILGYDD